MTADSQVSKHMFSQPNTIYPKEKVLLYFLVFTECQDVTKPAFLLWYPILLLDILGIIYITMSNHNWW